MSKGHKKILKSLWQYFEGRMIISEPIGERYDYNWDVACNIVYDGISLNENATFAMTGDMFDEEVIIEAPTLLEEDKDLPLAERVIHGFVFKPRRSA